jgi:hypothetical protein
MYSKHKNCQELFVLSQRTHVRCIHALSHVLPIIFDYRCHSSMVTDILQQKSHHWGTFVQHSAKEIYIESFL